MSPKASLSAKTLQTFVIDAVAFVSGLLSIVSGIYFLYLPTGGYQGGRNALYGVTILFDRHTWEGLHTWSSVAMISAVIVHFALHLAWVRMSGRRVANHVSGKSRLSSRFVAFNIAINAVVGLSFLACALSGVYFLFGPTGGYEGGANLAWDAGFLFSRVTWDLIHTWSGVLLSAGVVVHFAIHWRWVTRVTTGLFSTERRRPALTNATVQS